MNLHGRDEFARRTVNGGSGNGHDGNAADPLSVEESFRAEILRQLKYAPDEILADGEIHRFATRDDREDDAGWYRFDADIVPNGVFGDWRTGEKFHWRGELSRPLTPEERARIEKRRAARDDEQAQRQRAAARKAQKIVKAAPWTVDPDFPYLVRKKVGVHGLMRQSEEYKLAIPVFEDGETIVSLQFINGTGDKRFLTDGKIEGCWFPLVDPGQSQSEAIVIVEGYATGATIHETTGLPVIVAFNAGNLAPVAKRIAEKYPNRLIVIAADDDAQTCRERGTNPGVEKAENAARSVGGVVVVPPFDRDKEGMKPSDWNDLAKLRGKDQITAIFEQAVVEATRRRSSNQRRSHPVPPKDSELTPVMKLLDEALATDAPEPPMRDLNPIPSLVEVRLCEPMGLHALTSEGTNGEGEQGASRLPPPKTHMLAPHDEGSLTILIEAHVEFYKTVKGEDRKPKRVATRLPDCFVRKYLTYRDSKLPKVGILATMPMVLPNGELLATNGLDREHRIVFRIDPKILQLLPNGTPADDAIEEAMNFLVDEWLCDVQTDFAGKCVLIALALSILERALFVDRPVFWITAGQRGGGKTTVLNMIAAALFGKRAAAAAWSPQEEERRKALFALLRQSIPFVVFDNIKRGSTISCPHLEKACTSEFIEDRPLCESRWERVSSATIMAFTGNNVGPKGDLASRSLTARITVDRPDPENRSFRHTDPIGWTLDHRGQILAALYTILLGNPRLRQPPDARPQPKTRFKEWWHLIGSAIEHAARKRGEAIDFRQLFLDVETDDEEAASLGDLLQILSRRYPNKAKFKAADVRSLLTDNDDPDAATLRSILMPGEQTAPASKTINARLGAHVDAPTTVGGRVLILRRERQADCKGIRWFWVEGDESM